MKSAVIAFLLGLAWLAPPLDAAPSARVLDPTTADGRSLELLLVGLWMSGIEVGTLLVYDDGGRYWLTVEDLDTFASVQIRRDAGRIIATTPIGSVDLQPADFLVLEGREHISPVALRDKLRIQVELDPAEFALVLSPPWLGARPGGSDRTEQLEPDIKAPSYSLSRANIEFVYSSDGITDALTSRTIMEGRAVGGRWRIRYQDDLAENRRLDEYTWVRPLPTGFLLLGRQRLSLHPLLGSFELTGVQYAYSNTPLASVDFDPGPDAMIPRGLQPIRNFTGEGPPGGIAELYINDRYIARQTIRLNGEYEFVDVPVSSHISTRVEIRVYDRFERATPLEIQQQQIGASQFQLKEGAMVYLGGIGVAGNLLDATLFDNASSSDDANEPAGFYQWRYGLKSHLTLEAALQKTEHRTQLLGGIVSQPFGDTTISAALAMSDARFGYDFTLETSHLRWRLLASSWYRQSEFYKDDEIDTFDHWFDLSYEVNETLDLSLIGRDRRSRSDGARFILPAIAWRPSSRVYLLARPDSDGEYRIDSSYQLTQDTRASVRYQSSLFADLQHRINSNFRGQLSAYSRDDQQSRYGATLYWRGDSAMRPAVRAGLLTDGQSLGYIAGASLEPTPGVYLAFDASSEPVIDDFAQEEDLTFRATVSVDFGLAGGRLVPTSRAAYGGTYGGIGGQLKISDAEGLPDYDLSDVNVSVQGVSRGLTSSNGTFFVGNLKPGVYRVSLDSENLPIELVPEHRTTIVEVAAGAVTRVDFTVHPEFGIAGRVTDAQGQGVAGREVALIGSDGSQVDKGTTDQFGLYRLDGAPPGVYTLKLLPSLGETDALPSRGVQIIDDFLFDQDLTIAGESETGAL